MIWAWYPTLVLHLVGLLKSSVLTAVHNRCEAHQSFLVYICMMLIHSHPQTPGNPRSSSSFFSLNQFLPTYYLNQSPITCIIPTIKHQTRSWQWIPSVNFQFIPSLTKPAEVSLKWNVFSIRYLHFLRTSISFIGPGRSEEMTWHTFLPANSSLSVSYLCCLRLY